MNKNTTVEQKKLGRLQHVLGTLIAKSQENLDSDHLTKYAGGFESARLKIKAETETQIQAFKDILSLLNDDKVNFKNQDSVIKLNDESSNYDENQEKFVNHEGLHINNEFQKYIV
jgi:hypothetical protein